MTFYSRTHIGLVRKKNEDSCFAAEQRGVFFAVVADGMGGHNGGEVASKLVIDTVRDFLAEKEAGQIVLDDIKQLLSRANKTVWERACRDKELKGMGSTATMAVVCGSLAMIGHVGDSRAYIFRNGKLEQMTKDHSYVQILIESGYITPEEALNHPQRNIITRAIGTENEVDSDLLSIDIQMGDVLLLCSDGLNNTVLDEKITEILNNGVSQAADKLIEESLSAGGSDNISVIIAEMDGDTI